MRAKRGISALLMSCLILGGGAARADKLFKWTDAEGNVHYTDQQPTPKEAKKQERRRFGDKPNDVALPYVLQRAIKNYPVTLFNSDCGDACTKAAALLAQRGVPYMDKNARDAAAGEELKALIGGKLEVPVLKLGNQVMRGFEEGAWNQALDAAGYPRTAVLPPKLVAKGTAVAKSTAPSTEPAKDEKAAAKGDKPIEAPARDATPPAR